MDGCPKAVWLPNDDYYGHIGRDGMGVTQIIKKWRRNMVADWGNWGFCLSLRIHHNDPSNQSFNTSNTLFI